jgi:hypothetical protein
MPTELNYHIIGFIHEPTKPTSRDIKSCARHLENISLFNKKFSQICSKGLQVLKKIDGLVNKYSKYNVNYENLRENWMTDREFDPKGNPQLLDALFTGCRFPFADSTFQEYTPEIEQDIKDIVKLTPRSMNCVLGALRCRNEVSPLAAACINNNIPLHIVEFLLQQGANPKVTLKLNGRDISLLADLEGNIDAARFSAIRELFVKYGAL